MKLLLVCLLFLTACTLTGNVIIEPVVENNKPLEVYFCPQEDCKTILIDFIQSAQKSVDCAFFDLSMEEVIGALEEKNARIFIDGDYTLAFPRVRYDTKSQLSHNKFCVVDRKKVLTGSFNPTTTKNYNNMVILYSKYLAKNYQDEFDELWSGTNGGGEAVSYPVIKLNNHTVENYFCPEDNCAEHIIKILRTAKKSIYFMQYSFTHDGIGDSLVERFNAGVDVKGIFESSQNNKYTEYTALQAAGIQVQWDNQPILLHHKVFIIDEKIVVTGSMNPSKNGDENNDENVVIIHDREVARKFVDEFLRAEQMS